MDLLHSGEESSGAIRIRPLRFRLVRLDQYPCESSSLYLSNATRLQEASAIDSSLSTARAALQCAAPATRRK